jgi:hypothetical protein
MGLRRSLLLLAPGLWLSDGQFDAAPGQILDWAAAEFGGGPAGPDSYADAWLHGGFADNQHATWFGRGAEARGPRPPLMVELNHSIGTVYTHRSGARGVIVGWDARTRAPKSWLDQNVPRRGDGTIDWPDRMRRLFAPHYSVLEERPGGAPALLQPALQAA